MRRFGHELRVVQEPGQEDVVLLWHRYHARDACHAIVSLLEPEAEIPVPGVGGDAERFDALVSRCRDWLSHDAG